MFQSIKQVAVVGAKYAGVGFATAIGATIGVGSMKVLSNVINNGTSAIDRKMKERRYEKEMMKEKAKRQAEASEAVA